MKISLGPIQYFWPKNRVIEFYDEIAGTAVDSVYLGEAICYKRTELRLQDWMSIARKLADRGKEVVLSTLTLLEAAAELHAVRKVCDNGEFMVEANDIAAVNLLAEANQSFVAGPSINIYNSRSLNYLYRVGMRRWVMPVELGRDTLQAILAELDNNATPETEIFTYGRLPLAYSARCFTARAHNLPKDRCELKCLGYPDGLLLESQEEQTLFTLNGIQIQSGDTCDLRPQWREMEALGVDILRISPQSTGTADIIAALHSAMKDNAPLPDNTGSCNGYWFGQSGLERVVSPE